MATKRRYLVETAPTDAVEEFAAGLPASFLECRELGHNWKPWTAVNMGRHYERVLRCARCHTKRIEALSLRGEVLSRNMQYPDGYLAQKMGRIVGDGRGVLRLESLSRFIDSTQNMKRSAELRVVS